MISFYPLSDIITINPRFNPREGIGASDKVAFLPMSAVSEAGYVASLEERALQEVQKGYTYFQQGDVLLAKITPCMENGKAALVRNLPYSAGFGSTEFHVLRAGPKVDKGYLFHAVWNESFRRAATRNMTGTAGQRRVPTSFLERYKIPRPPRPGQKRIAAILDKADAIRRKRQEAIKLSEQFLKSVFLEMFGDPVTNPKGWEKKSLQDVAEIVSGVTKGRNLQSRETLTLPYLRVANVQDGYLDLKEIKTIAAVPEDLAKYHLEYGDILLTEGGDYDKLGRGAIWHNEIDPCIHQNHIFRVRLFCEDLLPDYLCALIGSPRGKRYFLSQAKQTTGIATINSRQLKAFPVLVPPKHLQERYSAILDNTNELTSRIHDSVIGLDQLSNSLSHRAFKGEL